MRPFPPPVGTLPVGVNVSLSSVGALPGIGINLSREASLLSVGALLLFVGALLLFVGALSLFVGASMLFVGASACSVGASMHSVGDSILIAVASVLFAGASILFVGFDTALFAESGVAYWLLEALEDALGMEAEELLG
jgi:hypothetical protein